MSATREHRNAGLIEDAVDKVDSTVEDVEEAVTAVEALNKELGFVLPDDWEPIHDELYHVRTAVENMRTATDKLRNKVQI